MIFLGIIAWVLCAGVTFGVILHIDPDEWGGEFEPLGMFVCLFSWPLFAVFGIGYLVMKKLSKIGVFFAGFIDRLMDKGDKE